MRGCWSWVETGPSVYGSGYYVCRFCQSRTPTPRPDRTDHQPGCPEIDVSAPKVYAPVELVAAAREQHENLGQRFAIWWNATPNHKGKPDLAATFNAALDWIARLSNALELKHRNFEDINTLCTRALEQRDAARAAASAAAQPASAAQDPTGLVEWARSVHRRIESGCECDGPDDHPCCWIDRNDWPCKESLIADALEAAQRELAEANEVIEHADEDHGKVVEFWVSATRKLAGLDGGKAALFDDLLAARDANVVYLRDLSDITTDLMDSGIDVQDGSTPDQVRRVLAAVADLRSQLEAAGHDHKQRLGDLADDPTPNLGAWLEHSTRAMLAASDNDYVGPAYFKRVLELVSVAAAQRARAERLSEIIRTCQHARDCCFLTSAPAEDECTCWIGVALAPHES